MPIYSRWVVANAPSVENAACPRYLWAALASSVVVTASSAAAACSREDRHIQIIEIYIYLKNFLDLTYRSPQSNMCRSLWKINITGAFASYFVITCTILTCDGFGFIHAGISTYFSWIVIISKAPHTKVLCIHVQMFWMCVVHILKVSETLNID